MSTEEQRARNRQKQKKWRDGHRDLVRARYQYRKLLRVTFDHRILRADFRTFELADPRDAPNLVPRLIGYCHSGQQPVWKALWEARTVSSAKWAAWFRELEIAGLEPVELENYVLGVPMPLNLWLIRRTVAIRLRMVCGPTGDPHTPPPWLINEIRVGGKGKCRRIGRLLPDGTVERFCSLREGSRVSGLSKDWIDHLAATCSVDSGGATWFDD